MLMDERGEKENGVSRFREVIVEKCAGGGTHGWGVGSDEMIDGLS